MRLTATVEDEDGGTMPGVGVSWSSSDNSVVTVNSNGVVRSVGNGTATVRVSVEDVAGVMGTVEVIVEQRAAEVRVSPQADTLILPGDTVRLSAEAMDANGHVIEDAQFTWSSGDESVVTVDADGLARALGEGTALVGALVVGGDGAAGEATVTVRYSQRAMLLKVHDALDGPRWHNSTNWGRPSRSTSGSA